MTVFLIALLWVIIAGGLGSLGFIVLYALWHCPHVGTPRFPQIPPVPTRPILVDREGIAYPPSRRVVLRAKP